MGARRWVVGGGGRGERGGVREGDRHIGRWMIAIRMMRGGWGAEVGRQSQKGEERSLLERLEVGVQEVRKGKCRCSD